MAAGLQFPNSRNGRQLMMSFHDATNPKLVNISANLQVYENFSDE